MKTSIKLNQVAIILFACLCLFTITSCKKDTNSDNNKNGSNNNGGGDTNNPPDSKGSIVANFDFEPGKKINYKSNMTGTNDRVSLLGKNKNDVDTLLIVGGNMEKDGIEYGLSFILYNFNGVGVYTFDTLNLMLGGVGIDAHNPNIDGTYPPMALQNNKLIYGSITINVTSITQDHIKADFSAKLYKTNATQGEYVVVTNGELDAYLERNN